MASEHPLPPRTLAAPLHRHSREAEYSYVIEGIMGVRLGPDMVEAEAGSLAFKARGQWHTFWNAGEGPCRVLEVIALGGFEETCAARDADAERMRADRRVGGRAE